MPAGWMTWRPQRTASKTMKSVLHANRALALVKLHKWVEAEADGTRALQLNSKNYTAQYRRALARNELNMLADSIEDVE